MFWLDFAWGKYVTKLPTRSTSRSGSSPSLSSPPHPVHFRIFPLIPKSSKGVLVVGLTNGLVGLVLQIVICKLEIEMKAYSSIF